MVEKSKWALAALKFAKSFPKIGLFGVLAGAAYFGYQHVDNQIKQTAMLKEQVSLLVEQNSHIRTANEDMLQSMADIKKKLEVYNRTLNEVRTEAKSLSNKFTSKEYRVLLQTDLPKAERDFNKMFNEYLQSIEEMSK